MYNFLFLLFPSNSIQLIPNIDMQGFEKKIYPFIDVIFKASSTGSIDFTYSCNYNGAKIFEK